MTGNLDRKLRLPRIHFRVLLHAANMRHGTNGFTSLPKEGVLRIFSPWKIQQLGRVWWEVWFKNCLFVEWGYVPDVMARYKVGGRSVDPVYCRFRVFLTLKWTRKQRFFKKKPWSLLSAFCNDAVDCWEYTELVVDGRMSLEHLRHDSNSENPQTPHDCSGIEPDLPRWESVD